MENFLTPHKVYQIHLSQSQGFAKTANSPKS